MKNKLLLITLPATLLLVAAAFFLPGYISRLQDNALMDSPQIQTLEDSREEFSDSIRLSVPEKLMLLRNGNLSWMELGTPSAQLRVAVIDGEIVFYESEEPVLSGKESGDGDEAAQEWSSRIAAVMGELRGLQEVGGLPRLWSREETVELTGQRELLYIDNDTQVSFTVYYMEVNAAPYTMGLTVDGQTNRILTFTLRWGVGDGPLNWGRNGASTFGPAWRDYWGMDQVDEWYGGHRKSILEDTESMLQLNGSYTATAEMGFVYDGQALEIPLYCWASGGRGCGLQWNI